MNKKIKLIFNALIYLILGFFLVQRIPSIVDSFKRQGKIAPMAEVTSLSGQSLQIPLPGKQILVFWATWCGPCKLELGRINSLIKDGKIRAESVLAISLGEDPAIVRSEVKKQDYLFSVATDSTSAVGEKYKVVATPTVVFVNEKGIAEWITSGLSPSLELRTLNFLND